MGWWRDAWGHPHIRALGLGLFLSFLATLSLAVSASVYAYQSGGAPLVAYFGAASTLPGVVLTPLLMGAASRGRAEVVLRRTTLVRVGLVGGGAAAELAGLSPVLVVSLLALSACLGATFRATQALLLPWLARTPSQLAAANVAATVSENTAALTGPALAGIVLLVADPVAALLVAAGVLVLTVVVLTRVDAPEQVSVTRTGADRRRALSATRSVLRLGPTGGVVALVFAQTFTRGALGVLLVLLALDTLGLQNSSVGWLNAAIGLGGLAGAAVGFLMVRVARLARFFVVGVLLWGLGTAALAGAPGLAIALLALAVVGVGNALEDSGVFTLVPRRLGPREAAAGLGALEVVAVAGIAAGALLAPALAGALAVRGAIAGIGGVLVALTLAYGTGLARLDREESGPSPDLELVRGLPAFSVLPVVVLEELAGALTEEHYPSGATVVAEGAPGDRFQVVREGRAAVHVRGVERRVLGPGDGFGEIALLRDVPRTATVTALSDLTTLALERSDFLGALATTPSSRAHADAGAEEKLGGDP